MKEHHRIIIKNICSADAENEIDGNLGTKCEWLDGSDNTGNIYVVSAMNKECYISALNSLEEIGANIEEL